MAEPLSKQAARAAYGWGRDRDWREALRLLEAAAKAGEPKADQQLQLLTQMPIDQLLAPPAPERLSGRARIAVAHGFAPTGFSEWMIERAAPDLVPAQVNDAAGTGIRTAHTCGFGPQDRDLVLAILQERAARLIGTPITHHEPPNVISYEPGQMFGMHADFVEPSIPQFQADIQRFGQRTGTFITYLNDDFEGAETIFPELGIKFRGAPGDALFFANVLPDGTPDYSTKHAGLPPTSGRKWILSQWIRSKPFPYLPEALA